MNIINRNLLIIFLLCIALIIYLMLNKREHFVDFDSKLCGTAGFKLSKATNNYFKAIGWEFPSKRLYTPSECKKLENGTWTGGTCKNGELDYGEKCAELNTLIPSSPPNECKVDNIMLGKPNEPYTGNVFGKQIVVEKGAIQLYTKNECNLLGGNFTSLEDGLKKGGTSTTDAAKVVQANGENYGTCEGKNGMSYGIMCTVDQPASIGGDVKDSAKKYLTNWLK